jgi:hypothetical protein
VAGGNRPTNPQRNTNNSGGSCIATSAGGSNVRAAPDPNAPLVTTLGAGSTVAVFSFSENGWFQVPGGWIAGSTIQLSGDCGPIFNTSVTIIGGGNNPGNANAQPEPTTSSRFEFTIIVGPDE